MHLKNTEIRPFSRFFNVFLRVVKLSHSQIISILRDIFKEIQDGKP